jgi:hypothetical protein
VGSGAKEDEVHILSRENSPIGRASNYPLADSPDSKQRQELCSSPVDSSRSYSSQNKDELGYNSPHNDSIGSHSPENLSYNNNNNNNNNNNHLKKPSNPITEMLDHKLQLSFLGPPLAALHSMTEMKSQGSPQTASQASQGGTGNPHGIDTILSRPPPVTSAQLNALTGGEYRWLFGNYH